MKDLVLLLSADLDTQRAYERFEDLREGKGEEFLSRLDQALGQLKIFPQSGPVAYRTYRRLNISKFPLAIIYAVEARGVIVSAVVDLRMNWMELVRQLP